MDVRQAVRGVIRWLARQIDSLSGGKVTPNSITIFGLALHVPVAVLIAVGEHRWAAAGLVVFGLFDVLDGELARLQSSVSDRGGFLDASTDRVKEVLLYSGAAYWLAEQAEPRWAVVAVAACGLSICVSFVKAKGEAIVASRKHKIPYPELNRMFSGGVFPFEVRMAVLVLGLITGTLIPALCVVAVGSGLTVLQRIYTIGRRIA